MWWAHLPMIFCGLWVFALGLGIGSFLNVLIARLPYEKSIIWPGSRCFSCFAPIRFTDNLPIIGYLRLRGKCRSCGAKFSVRYLFVEIGTGLAFLALFFVEVVLQSTGGPDFIKPWHFTPGLQFPYFGSGPPVAAWILFATHAFLLAALIASSVIDYQHRIIPPQITYVGTIVGIIASTLFPWPWPTTDPNFMQAFAHPQFPWQGAKLPTGITIWPFWGPQFDWAPAGSHQLGLLNGLVGAAVGMMIGRGIKLVFELGLNKEALGLGDADLLMMSGAFLGWQAISMALPLGSVLTLCVVVPMMIWAKIRGKPTEAHLPFGPGIAAGVVCCWFGWPYWRQLVQPVLFDSFLLVFGVIIAGGGMLIAGLFLRKGGEKDPR
jgi:leader peptidase (prepilin peptidase)/N-methyltransferase